jgi:DNA-binding transcriptional regulator YiaG
VSDPLRAQRRSASLALGTTGPDRTAPRNWAAIKALREQCKLTQSEVAGLTERQVRRVEQGESTPRSETLRKLAAATDFRWTRT